ncbi:hypothetical protein TEA_024543 [Camellia sinensis var. sinensis]|uniref:3-methyl-2-oxobutanoate hydroxymethyltransferase n=1 Tax=Camellia sinensis var. sinensis TaxID=542762 RepID=A0A4S4EZK9_CAMSN|nr:hypothetical protein TEA_024543 [Camellia sinensis var. sinensis]
MPCPLGHGITSPPLLLEGPTQLSSSEALLPQLHSYGGAVLQHNVDGKRDHMLQKHRERPTRELTFRFGNKMRTPKISISYVPNPVLVIIDVEPKEMGIPTKAYYAVEEVKENATQKSQKVFVHVPSEIAAHDVQKLLFCCLILLLSSVLFLTVTARSPIFKVLVYHDLLGMMQHPHHAKYGQVGDVINKALSEYKEEVTNGSFPGPAHSLYKINTADVDGFLNELQKLGLDKAASAAATAAEKIENAESPDVYVVYMGSRDGHDRDEILMQNHQFLTDFHGGSVEQARASHVYSYRHGFRGFAAKLTEDQASEIASFVGELHPDKNSNKKHVLYTHKNIIVKYKDQVICL